MQNSVKNSMKNSVKKIQLLRLLLTGLVLFSTPPILYATTLSNLSSTVEDPKKELENQRAEYIRKNYAKFEYRVPARDGTLLFTRVSTPAQYLAKFTSSGTPLFSTYLSGSDPVTIRGVHIAPNGEIIVNGWTDVPDYPNPA